jgi:flagellar biosynthetic protein FliR
VNIAISEAALAGYLLALVRATAWLFIAPPFGGRMIPVQVKLGFAAAMALVAGPVLAQHPVPLEVVPLMGAAVLQVFAGVALGYVGVIVFGVVQAAGGLIDAFSGFNMAQMVDPTSTGMVSVFGRFYQVLATTMLFTLNGHVFIVRGFLASFEAAPLDSVRMDRMMDLVTIDLGRFIVAALEISAPLIAALLLTDLALGVLSRAAPNMNVFMLGMPLKMIVTIGLAAVALPLLPSVVEALFDPMVRQGLQIVGAG